VALGVVLTALTGQRKAQPPPVEAIPDIRALAGAYARCVHDAPPFTDILGPWYMDWISRFSRQEHGLFFTPPAVARMMAAMLRPADLRPKPDGDLYRVYEPASGSGSAATASQKSMDQEASKCE